MAEALLHSKTKSEVVADLGEKVCASVEEPSSKYSVAIQLELLGLNDRKVRETYGYDSVFQLADRVYDYIRHELARERSAQPGNPMEGGNGTAEAPVIPRNNGRRRNGMHKAPALDLPGEGSLIRTFLRHFGKGLLGMAPLFSQILSVVLVSYSLWAWLFFNEFQATMVALGTISAFLVTGGLSFYASREITSYLQRDTPGLAARTARQVLGMGVGLLLAAALGLHVLNLLTPLFPHSMLIMSNAYMFFIGTWLLASTLLYAMERYMAILYATLGGTAAVILGMEVLGWGIYLSHWTGMLLSALAMAVHGLRILDRQQQKDNGNNGKDFSLPPLAQKFYQNRRYFLYGTLYFLFLFMDRLMAWSAGSPPPEYPLWFDTSYELGMDWALIGLILITASSEYSINRFSELVLPLQEKLSRTSQHRFKAFFRHFYRRQVLILLGVAVSSILASYFAVHSLRGFADEVRLIHDFFSNEVLYPVFWLASLGYLFTALGLMNTLFFFTIGRPAKVVRAMTAALLVNASVGFACSRLISYEFAVLGLVAGGFTLAGLTVYYLLEMFDNLPYYYYSAY
ncbi:MAG: hypothetical protein U5K31_00715 [Balneolaceae bacterium]|nr:hypothetical protein [Balneolaceae bacterium]